MFCSKSIGLFGGFFEANLTGLQAKSLAGMMIILLQNTPTYDLSLFLVKRLVISFKNVAICIIGHRMSYNLILSLKVLIFWYSFASSHI